MLRRPPGGHHGTNPRATPDECALMAARALGFVTFSARPSPTGRPIGSPPFPPKALPQGGPQDRTATQAGQDNAPHALTLEAAPTTPRGG